jgi:hypothetical protein
MPFEDLDGPIYRPVPEDVAGLVPYGPPAAEPDPYPEIDRLGEPVGWYKGQLATPSGELLPVLQQVDQRLLLSTKVRTCEGCDSWCAAKCPLTEERQEAFRGRPCPVELQRAWDVLLGFCRELQVTLESNGSGQIALDQIIEQVTQIDLINEYVFWDLVALRASMELASSSIVEAIPVMSKGGETLYQPQLNPLLEASEKATNLKLRIQKEFMTTRRGRLEAALKQVETQNSLAQYLLSMKARASLAGETIEVIDEG